MIIVYVNWHEEAWSSPVFLCTQRLSGAKVIVISDSPLNKQGTEWRDIARFGRANEVRDKLIASGLSVFEACCIARWFVLAELVHCHNEYFPMFCADRDEFILFPEVPVGEFDYGATFNDGLPRAPILLNRWQPLRAFCDQIYASVIYSAPAMVSSNDMSLWGAASVFCRWKPIDLAVPINGAVFDHGLGQGESDFLFSDGRKMVVWQHNKPYFVRKSGEIILARSIHCWGPTKDQITTIQSNLGVI